MKRLPAIFVCALIAVTAATGCGDKKPTETPGADAAPEAPAAETPIADHHDEEEEHHDEAALAGKPVVPNGEATVGDVTNCPVSNEKFMVSAESPSMEHEGKTYYFCCQHCFEQAQSEPAKFLAAKE